MEAKRVHRLPPCPAYEIAATQFWLEQLAREGLHLERFNAGAGIFVQGAPTGSRYRLDVYLSSQNPLEDGPAKKAVELAREFGWDYVCRRGQFAVYRTDDPLAPELHTDRKLQALSLRTLERQSVIFFLQLLLLLFLDGLFTVRAGYLLAAIHAGLWLPILVAVLSIGYPIALLYRLVTLFRTRQALKRGESLPLPQDLKKHGIRYQAGRCLLILAVATLVAAYLIHWKVDGIDRGAERRFLDAFAGQPPFATVADLAPEGATLSRWLNHVTKFNKDLNTFARWSSLPAANVIRWEEYRTATPPSGQAQKFLIEVYYYELRGEWLAKWLFGELSLQSWVDQTFFTQPVSLPDLPVDQAKAYDRFGEVLLLRKGRQVLLVYFSDYNDPTLADCARIFAESLK